MSKEILGFASHVFVLRTSVGSCSKKHKLCLLSFHAFAYWPQLRSFQAFTHWLRCEVVNFLKIGLSPAPATLRKFCSICDTVKFKGLFCIVKLKILQKK